MPGYTVEYAKSGRSSCKGCKQTIGQGSLRIGKLVPSPHFDGEVPMWFHQACFFKREKIVSIALVKGVEGLRPDDQKALKSKVAGLNPTATVTTANVAAIAANALTEQEKIIKNAEDHRMVDDDAHSVEYSAEKAKSGRSTCAACGKTIDMGTLRILREAQVDYQRYPEKNFYHVDCAVKRFMSMDLDNLDLTGLSSDNAASIRETFKKERIDVTKSITDEMKSKGKRKASDSSSTKKKTKKQKSAPSLSDEDIAAMKVADLKAALKERSLPVTGKKDELATRLKEAVANEGGEVDGDDEADGGEEDTPMEDTEESRALALDQKMDSLIEAEARIHWEIRDTLKKQSTTKDWRYTLQYNNQPIEGGPDLLLDRMVDLLMYGQLPPCPSCNTQALRYENGAYKCHGHASEWARCQWSAPDVDRKPFVPADYEHPYLSNYKFKKHVKPLEAHQHVAKKTQVVRQAVDAIAEQKEQMKLKRQQSMERAVRNHVLFSGLSFFITTPDATSLQSLLTSMSGTITSAAGPAQLCIVPGDQKHDLNEQQQEAIKAGTPLIAETWIHDCAAQGQLLDISSYSRHTTSTDKLQDWIKQKRNMNNKSKSNRKVKVKGRSAVNADSGLVESGHVLEEGKDVWNVVLNQTDISKGMNSYYILQLIENDRGGGWHVFRKWGRIGTEKGGSKLEAYYDKESAKNAFRAVYVDKTGNDWETRHDFEKVPGKMFPVEVDYGEDEELESKSGIAPGSQSKLDRRVQSIIEIFFDIQKMKDALMEMEIDMEKMPLGKLSKNHIKKGYSVLTQIQEAIRNNTDETQFLALSNQFYTLIPHDFGTKNAPLLKTEQQVKEKLNVIETLLDIEVATTLLKEGMNAKEDPIDMNYQKLKTNIVPIEKSDPTYEMICKYVANTHAPTHRNYKLEVVDLFTLDRENEADRYRDFEKDKNRQLLWHGSRTTNFVGILSQGLRIAPPEAPVTGYMFGKGVYFADMVTKSANYCFTNRENNTGFLILCEVALGDMYQIKRSEYMEKAPAGKLSTKGLGGTHPDPAQSIKLENGCVVPLGTPCPNVAAEALLYNEYIVYDVKQIRMKYLVRAKFNYTR